jgi:hypothetical protein
MSLNRSAADHADSSFDLHPIKQPIATSFSWWWAAEGDADSAGFSRPDPPVA